MLVSVVYTVGSPSTVICPVVYISQCLSNQVIHLLPNIIYTIIEYYFIQKIYLCNKITYSIYINIGSGYSVTAMVMLCLDTILAMGTLSLTHTYPTILIFKSQLYVVYHFNIHVITQLGFLKYPVRNLETMNMYYKM